MNDHAFNGIEAEFYFDDCLVAEKDKEEHDSRLMKVIERAREQNIKFNPHKVQCRQKEIKFLGKCGLKIKLKLILSG